MEIIEIISNYINKDNNVIEVEFRLMGDDDSVARVDTIEFEYLQSFGYGDNFITNEKPESYLKRNYREGISTFALLTKEEIEFGCKKLRKDIKSSAIENIIRQYEEKRARFGATTIIYGKKL